MLSGRCLPRLFISRHYLEITTVPTSSEAQIANGSRK